MARPCHASRGPASPLTGVKEPRHQCARNDAICRVGSGNFTPSLSQIPDVILSHHPARAIARRLPPSAEIAGERLHEEITDDYNKMIYTETPKEIETRRKAFIRKWRLKHEAVANSLEEAGDRLFTFMRLPPSQWRSARTTNAIERLHEEFKRRIKTQTCCRRRTQPPCCSGRCSLPARSTCEKSMDSKPSLQSPSISNLISPHICYN
jgi:Transposase, Mutator family